MSQFQFMADDQMLPLQHTMQSSFHMYAPLVYAPLVPILQFKLRDKVHPGKKGRIFFGCIFSALFHAGYLICLSSKMRALFIIFPGILVLVNENAKAFEFNNVTCGRLLVMSRSDARRPSELRSQRALHCRKGEILQASGSARWSQGTSCVLASVYGPGLTSNSEADEKTILDVNFYHNKIDMGDREADYKKRLQDALNGRVILKAFPRCYIKLNIQVLFDGGALLSCAFNAAFHALMNAGIPLKSQWGGITVAWMQNDEMYIDPTQTEEQKAKAVVSVVFPAFRECSESNEVSIQIEPMTICCSLNGMLPIDRFESTLEICRQGIEKIIQFNCEASEKDFQHLQKE